MNKTDGNSDAQRLHVLEGKVDTLLALQRKRKNLLDDPGQLIAIAAFVISVVTTIYSWNRDRRADDAALELQLRSSLARLDDLQNQRLDLVAKYKNDPALAQMSFWGNSQLGLNSREASYFAKRLGDSVLPVEIFRLAQSFISTGDSLQAQSLLLNLVQRKDLETEDSIAALRTLGTIAFSLSDPDKGRVYFTTAIKETNSASITMPKYVASNFLANIELAWASASYPNCEEAKQHLSRANEYAFLAGTFASTIIQQISDMKPFLEQGCLQSGSPAPIPR